MVSKYIILAALTGLVGAMDLAYSGVPDKTDELSIGSPVVVVTGSDGQDHTKALGAVVLTLRSDGSVGWKLSEVGENSLRQVQRARRHVK